MYGVIRIYLEPFFRYLNCAVIRCVLLLGQDHSPLYHFQAVYLDSPDDQAGLFHPKIIAIETNVFLKAVVLIVANRFMIVHGCVFL